MEQIPPTKPEPKTRDIRAKSAGTNAKYIDLADKVLETRPDMAAQIEAGKERQKDAGGEVVPLKVV